MPMLINENPHFAFSYRKALPFKVATRIWQRWGSQSTWKEWDKSIFEIIDGAGSITTGQQFFVVPHRVRQPIHVTVVSAVEGLHFTTASTGAMGLLAFGHTIIKNEPEQTITLEHSICVVPVDEEAFLIEHWDRLKRDIAESVEALSHCVMME